MKLETLTKEEADRLVDKLEAHYVNGMLISGVKSDRYFLMSHGDVYVQRGDIYVKVPEEEGR